MVLAWFLVVSTWFLIVRDHGPHVVLDGPSMVPDSTHMALDGLSIIPDGPHMVPHDP